MPPPTTKKVTVTMVTDNFESTQSAQRGLSRAERLTDILANAARVDLDDRSLVLDYVHALQAEGVAVLPLRAGEKLPATPNGVHGATTDPAAFDAMYSTGCNLGMNLGASGIVVVDADTPAEVKDWQDLSLIHI